MSIFRRHRGQKTQRRVTYIVQWKRARVHAVIEQTMDSNLSELTFAIDSASQYLMGDFLAVSDCKQTRPVLVVQKTTATQTRLRVYTSNTSVGNTCC